METIVLHFTNVYDAQNFETFKNTAHIDCQNLQGVDCFCSEEAATHLKEKIAAFSPHGIHFLDSGNYHYMTKLWTDKIAEPFSLLLFDRHTDLQSSSLFDLLSCGSWVKYMLEENSFLQQILIIGPEKNALERDVKDLPASMQERISFISLDPLPDNASDLLLSWVNQQGDTPYYLSIDKDLLSLQDAVTNWDQGNISLHTLLSLLTCLKKGTCIGVDICGECQPDLDFIELSKVSSVNQKANSSLYDICRHILSSSNR